MSFQEIVNLVITSFEFKAFVRLAITAFACALIGFEREEYGKPAGTRTHMLVGVSAALVMITGIYLSDLYPDSDVGRIPAAILSGIGFIGAGTILTNGLRVKGLTTAASLLSVATIGLIIGAGAYAIGIIASFVVYIILSFTFLKGNKEKKLEKQRKFGIEDIEKDKVDIDD
jgi:putative Mg2+ transporter-C (MgtC) family protein